MKISWSWLSDFVDLDRLTPDEVGDALTMAGLELDGIERVGTAYESIVVAEIVSIDPHPQADKLVLCHVRAGDGPVQVVCGATNMKAGDKVPMIPAGEVLPNGTKISRGKIRGQLSNGMLCSEIELELGDDASGLMILPADAPVGTSLGAYMGLHDTVLTLDLTPNRGDALSHLGVAREVAALFGRERRYPGALGGADPLASGNAGPAADYAEVIIEDAIGCPRYAAAVMLDVAVAPAPLWMANRLSALGQRPVNNLVDVTNYVMFETGQPLHVFDLDRLTETAQGKRRIVVRRAHAGESIVSIDHVERELSEEDVVITDGAVPVAVAGVMGGLDSEVSEHTTRILIECAHFDPRAVRRTSKRLGLPSESSHRFERTVDIAGVERVMRRAVELFLQTLPNGSSPRVASGMVDVYPAPRSATPLDLRVSRCAALLGASFTAERVAELLGRIDLRATARDTDTITVQVPTFRPDLEREVDLIEEVGRLAGFDKLEAVLPTGPLGYRHVATGRSDLPQPIVQPTRLTRIERLRDLAADCGVLEAVNFAFVSRDAIDVLRFGADDGRSRPLNLANPLSEDWGVMRTSLLPGLLRNVRRNLAHKEGSVALFELGPVFVERANGDPVKTPVHESANLAVVLCGERPRRFGSEQGDYDSFDAKRVLTEVAAQLGCELQLENHDGAVPYLHPGVGALVAMGTTQLGAIGQIHPRVASFFGIDQPVFAFEVAVDGLMKAASDGVRFTAVPRYPSSSRDIAIVVDRHLPYGRVHEAFSQFKNALVESVELSSVYEGEPIPSGKKSIAMTVTYRSDKGSLTDKRVDAVHGRLVQHVVTRLNAELR